MRAIAGDGLTLEPQMGRHAAELYPLLSDPALYIFTDEKEPKSEEALKERFTWLEGRLSPDKTEHWLNWVVRSSTDVAVGFVQATVYPNGDAEIAYVFGRPYWRQGFGARAVELMLGELAATYSARRATATLDPQNTASLALLKKLGFAFVAEDEAAQEVRYARELPGAK